MVKKETKDEIRKEYFDRISPWHKDSIDLQEEGLYSGEEHWDGFLGKEKKHEYTNGFQHGYKHGYTKALDDVIAFDRARKDIEKKVKK